MKIQIILGENEWIIIEIWLPHAKNQTFHVENTITNREKISFKIITSAFLIIVGVMLISINWTNHARTCTFGFSLWFFNTQKWIYVLLSSYACISSIVEISPAKSSFFSVCSIDGSYQDKSSDFFHNFSLFWSIRTRLSILFWLSMRQVSFSEQLILIRFYLTF